MPRRKAGATQATQNPDDDEEAFEGEGMDLDDAEDNVPARKQKGAATRKTGTTSAATLSAEDIDKKAGDLCRLALFTEYRRAVLKREDINKKVMGGNSKAFPEVLAKANKRLKNALGYEIVELLPRAEREKTLLGGTLDADEEPKKRGASAKQYIVRSTLDSELIQVACTIDEDIQAQEQEDAGDSEAPISGSILAWQIHDQIPAYGTLCVILSLILVNGKTIPDATLRSQLKKLRLTSTSIIEVGTPNAPKKLTFEQYLTLVIKQGYLDRIKVGNTTGARTGGKRVRGGAARVDGEEGTVDLEWRWGERSHAEISEKGISDFVVSFMTEQSRPAGNIEEGEKARKDRLAKVKKQLESDIKKAAQTELTKIEGEAPEA